jgi:hypothetical protein
MTENRYRKTDFQPTIAGAFAKAGLAPHPGYEGFYYHNDPGCSDFSWFRYDAHDAQEGITGIQLFDMYEWTPIERCPGYSVDDVQLLHGQLPNAIPLNDIPLTEQTIDKLPGIVQDIWSGRFLSIDHARFEDVE